MKVIILGQSPDTTDDVVMALYFRWPEADVLVLSKGENIVKELEHDNIDIVILYFHRSDTTSSSIIKNIRNFSNVPILVIGSNIKDEKLLVRALELGADEYVQPPFSQMELLAHIKAVIRSRK